MAKSLHLTNITASAAVLALAVGFCLYAKNVRIAPNNDMYPLHARFVSANGLKPHAEIFLGGVPVGVVESITLNTSDYMADVKLMIDKNLHLPSDTRFVVNSSTMTSDYGIFLKPGKSRNFLQENATVTNTRDVASLEQQISNYIFGNGGLPEDSDD